MTKALSWFRFLLLFGLVINGKAQTVTSPPTIELWQGGSLAKPLLYSSDSGAVFEVIIGNNFTIEARAQGTAPVTLKWYKNGIAIAGSTSGIYTITAVSETDTADYKVEASNSFGITYKAFRITVAVPPRVALFWVLSSSSTARDVLKDYGGWVVLGGRASILASQSSSSE